ncbi:MAG: amino acid ABC transporter permease [Clostridiales bacterium]|jgi:polar amino acid transport system permease protein|nr:amino acid ABC transporter permease [Clostridiales bacterium]
MPDLGLEVLGKGKNFVRLLDGLWIALRISLIAAAISIGAGILLGIAASRNRSVASVILRIWLGIIRIMPQMVLLFLMYYGTTRAFGWKLSGEMSAIIVFSLWGTAEMGDLVRGAVSSVPVIQKESAEALGLKPPQVYRLIILPQAVRRLIPQSINLITRMIKTTSLVTLIGVVEILKVGQQIIDANRKTSPNAAFGVYLTIFLMYYLACRPLSLAAKQLEKRWR